MLDTKNKTIQRITALRADICWQIDALAPALGALSFRVTERVPTLAVDARGRCYVNEAFAATLSDAELRFAILHETLHPMLQHQDRRGDRHPMLWNLATDASINSVLGELKTSQANYVQRIKGTIHPSTHFPGGPAFASAEEYYAWLTQHPDAKQKCEESAGRDKDGKKTDSPSVGAGCGVEDEDGEPGQKGDGSGEGAGEEKDGSGSGDGEGEGEGSGPADQGLTPSQWRMVGQVVREHAERAASAGNAALGALAGFLNIPPPRVRWGDLLRRQATMAVAQAGRDDVSWSRRGRRSNATYTLPGSIVTRAKIAVVIDASGSVDDNALARAISETAAAVDATGVPAYLVIHDAAVHYEGWIKPGVTGRTLSGFVKGRGGTWFHPAYEAVGKLRDKFGSIVHFTDGMPGDPWPDVPSNCRRGVAALIGSAVKNHIPEGWQTVPVDLK